MWFYNGKEIGEDEIEGYASFVYRITNLESGKQYIGKKIFSRSKEKKVKGKTRRKKVEKDSDWKSYYGSNKLLQEDVAKLGPGSFRREILKLCKTRGTASYWEAKYQMEFGVLEDPDKWYNEWIMCKVHRSHIN